MSSTDLKRFRDHCRRKAAQTDIERPQGISAPCARPGFLGLTHDDCRDGHERCRCECHDGDREQPPTEAERALWERLADEVDAYQGGALS